MIKTRLAPIVLTIVFAFTLDFASAQQNDSVEPRYTYHETDGIFIYYETDKKEAYRQLLPQKFEMPDRLLVHAFICDFYKMDARTEPYKEGAIFLLAKYKGKKVWHCITMPVTSNESRLGGILRLGLPKIMGNIELSRQKPKYSGSVKIKSGHKMDLTVDSKDFTIDKKDKQLLRELTVIPKFNILRGKVVQMTGRGNRKARSVIEIANRFPRRMTLKFGKGKIAFGTEKIPKAKNGEKTKAVHAFANLTPTKILGSYYLKNTFKYKLGVMN